MKLQAVIFDLDGTLIDSMGIWEEVDHKFLGRRNIQVPIDLFENMASGLNLVGLATHFKEKFQLPDSIESIIQEWTDDVIDYYSHHIEVKPGAAELLFHLKQRNVTMAIGTSNSLLLTQKVLERHNLHTYFTAFLTSSDVEKGKPFPDVFIKTSEALGIAPENCVVIEDSLPGVQAAKAAGMTVIAIHDSASVQDHPRIQELADRFALDFVEVQEMINQYIEES